MYFDGTEKIFQTNEFLVVLQIGTEVHEINLEHYLYNVFSILTILYL